LVDGSAEDEIRQRKSKRRAIEISVAVESAALAALLVLPLLSKPAGLVAQTSVPIPPYSTSRPRGDSRDRVPHEHRTAVCVVCARLPVAPITPAFRSERTTGAGDLEAIPGATTGPDPGGSLENGLSEARPGPARPVEPRRPARLREPRIDQALLVYRVEPVFPPLARQIRRSGKVELRALIRTDGSIESLEVVSGDPLFIPSALTAVRQWRYRPTYLNGEPVEVETFIIVIYTLDPQ
jgi:TonB family protein